MAFQLGANVTSAKDLKTALERDRDRQVKDLGDPTDVADPTTAAVDVDARRAELDDLSDAGVAAAEAAIRKLKGFSSYQVSVSGHRNPDGPAAVSVSVNAIP